LISSISFAQLKCKDFKTGYFYIQNKNQEKTIIVRTENEQIEYQNKLGNNPMYLKIEWIDECSYNLSFNKEKLKDSRKPMSLGFDQALEINLVEIEGNCMIYNTTFEIDGKEVLRTNKICKQ